MIIHNIQLPYIKINKPETLIQPINQKHIKNIKHIPKSKINHVYQNLVDAIIPNLLNEDIPIPNINKPK